jgi:murein DD-endopeptidase MepM/ murein hydrolase activator NlpD
MRQGVNKQAIRGGAQGSMSVAAALAALVGCSLVCAAAIAADPAATSHSPFPLQVQLQVPFEPTAFPAEGSQHLLYELYVTNFEGVPITLDRVDVLDSARLDLSPLARFVGRPLNDIVNVVGAEMEMSDEAKPVRINAGSSAVLFMSVTLPSGASFPERLVQRLTFANGYVQGAPIGTRHTRLKVLAPPVDGSDWLAADGPGNGRYNHHRRGIFVVDGGSMRHSRRLAVDWKQVQHGSSFNGDKHAESSYYAYNKPVFAVAPATVVDVRDGLPDNPPGHGGDFHPALPVTFENAGGNTVVLDLGDGQFAHYYHLKPGSIQVKQGQRVRPGQVIGQIGASGDAREPHLHFEVSTAIPVLVGEGVPYVIDHFRVVGGEGHVPGVRSKESPLDDMVIDFDQSGQAAK